MTQETQPPSPEKGMLHPRNRHRGRYAFEALVRASPGLARFVRTGPHGGQTIDFAEPAAVRALNRALLAHSYGIAEWDLPEGYLCPPIPGRADYLHHAADLLAGDAGGRIPRGPSVAVLDVGVGASCIYPILGCGEYGWSFVGSDVDPVAVRNAARIAAAHPLLAGAVEIRRQRDPAAVFRGIIGPGDRFALTVCNPPFHASPEAAAAGNRRKVANLTGTRVARPVLNFGGTGRELWCAGGELAFVHRLIAESALFGERCIWFTTLVARSAHLPALRRALDAVPAVETRTVEMAQGQKRSRFLAWSFLPRERRRELLSAGARR